MKKKNNYFSTFYNNMGLDSKGEIVWFWITFTLFTIYTEWIVFAQNFHTTNNVSFSDILFAAALIPSCFYVVYKAKNIKDFVVTNKSAKKAFIFAALVFIVTFALYYIWQLSAWPGYFSVDASGQLAQIPENSYGDWHPVMHTLFIYWLPYKLFGSAAAIVTFQLILFSLAIAYLYSVLYRNGCSKAFIIISWLYIVLNYNTGLIMLYPWKDSAFSILSVVIFTQIIQIYVTDGIWLKKWYNLLAFIAVVFLTNGMRHNAVLLTAPIIVILFIFIKNYRKSIAVCAVAVIVATMLFKGPVFNAMDVTKPGYRQVEVLGMPMTILSHLYIADPDCLSDEAFEFMDNLTSPLTWETKYVLGNFNTVKWSEGITDKIESEGAVNILKYTINGSLKRPDLALQAFIALTRMVWAIDDSYGWRIYGEHITNSYISPPDPVEYFDAEITEYITIASNGFGKYLFNFTGPVILILILIAVAKIGNGNLSKSFMVLPALCYNFGTMMLLTGDDFRFFHLNFVIVIPLLYLFLFKKVNKEKSDVE